MSSSAGDLTAGGDDRWWWAPHSRNRAGWTDWTAPRLIGALHALALSSPLGQGWQGRWVTLHDMWVMEGQQGEGQGGGLYATVKLPKQQDHFVCGRRTTTLVDDEPPHEPPMVSCGEESRRTTTETSTGPLPLWLRTSSCSSCVPQCPVPASRRTCTARRTIRTHISHSTARPPLSGAPCAPRFSPGPRGSVSCISSSYEMVQALEFLARL